MKRRFTAALIGLITAALISGCGANSTSINDSGLAYESIETADGEASGLAGAKTDEKNASRYDTAESLGIEDGTYEVEVTLEGGSGKATVESPSSVTVKKGKITATIIWSSKYYDYMIVDGEKYENLSDEGENSSFSFPVKGFNKGIEVVGDTTAMSTPHEIDYTLTFYWENSQDDDLSEMSGSGNSGDDTAESFNVLNYGVNAGENSKTGTTKSKSLGEDEKTVLTNAKAVNAKAEISDKISWNDLSKTGSLTLENATQYEVDYYGDYTLINIENSRRFLLVPKGMKAPKDLPEDVVILQMPLDKTYLVSTSVMDFIDKIDALGYIRLSGTKEKDWYISGAKEAMKKGDVIYAGKYSAPDYELILSEGCNLAIENTMILHNPEVKEKLESLGIPVIVERSSYESDPIGRLEWIKLYGVLFDKEDEAKKIFDEEKNSISKVMEEESTNKTVAFFSVTTKGAITVRKPGDYISKMINLAGGNYILKSLNEEDDNALSTQTIQMEEFYAKAKDADILIYNSTIEGEISSVEDLLAKNKLFANFKAVKEGNVYCVGKELFQEPTGIGDFIKDLSKVMNGKTGKLRYMTKLR